MTPHRIANLQVATADDMHELGLRLAALLRAGDLVVLVGPLGAGKTTLSRGIGEGLAVQGTVSSPTFVIARTHKRTDAAAPLVHVDAYRLSSVAEFDDLDIDFANSITLVEWGRGFAEGVVDGWLEVEISREVGAVDMDATAAEEDADDPRDVVITGFGERWVGVEL